MLNNTLVFLHTLCAIPKSQRHQQYQYTYTSIILYIILWYMILELYDRTALDSLAILCNSLSIMDGAGADIIIINTNTLIRLERVRFPRNFSYIHWW
jgi:hypothetical protein